MLYRSKYEIHENRVAGIVLVDFIPKLKLNTAYFWLPIHYNTDLLIRNKHPRCIVFIQHQQIVE